ncbi:hypothetical protein [Halocatena marina]|uniref:hypothetical protein n=1 Tax=Halocatena marina TaxID=2934937 RepID=UPI00200D2C5A|nr:hypothetical protein [Halocatena marina]
MANSIIASLEDGEAYEEFPAASVITPGEGLELVVNGGEEQVQPVSTAGQPGTWVAREQRNPPRAGTGNPIDQNYVVGRNVEVMKFNRNSEGRTRLASGADLATAANANVSEGDLLEWYSDGTLKTGVSGTAVARAREAIDNSGAAAGENPVILAEFL